MFSIPVDIAQLNGNINVNNVVHSGHAHDMRTYFDPFTPQRPYDLDQVASA